MLLAWVVLAKRPKTRQKRINEIASQAAQQKLPKYMGQDERNCLYVEWN